MYSTCLSGESAGYCGRSLWRRVGWGTLVVEEGVDGPCELLFESSRWLRVEE